jgi:DNA polymerase V
MVDRSLKPRHGDAVVAVVDGERSLKRLDLSGPVPRLSFANAALPAFAAAELSGALIWAPRYTTRLDELPVVAG